MHNLTDIQLLIFEIMNIISSKFTLLMRKIAYLHVYNFTYQN